MKSIIYLFILFGLASCKVSSPTFKSLGAWQISKINGTQVTVSNVANFYNPNNIEGLKLNGINLMIQSEGRNIGKLEVSQPGMTFPKLSDFQIPISFVVNISDLIGNLSSIVSILSGQTVDVRCIGDVKVGYVAFGKSVKIDQTIPINIKDIKL